MLYLQKRYRDAYHSQSPTNDFPAHPDRPPSSSIARNHPDYSPTSRDTQDPHRQYAACSHSKLSNQKVSQIHPTLSTVNRKIQRLTTSPGFHTHTTPNTPHKPPYHSLSLSLLSRRPCTDTTSSQQKGSQCSHPRRSECALPCEFRRRSGLLLLWLLVLWVLGGKREGRGSVVGAVGWLLGRLGCWECVVLMLWM